MRRGKERGRRLPEILARSEWEKVAAAAGQDRREEALGRRDAAILGLFLWSGIRSGELAGLRRCDVDTENGVARVIGKGDKERLAPIGDQALQLLEAYLDERPDDPAQRGREYDPEKDRRALFISRKGGHLDTRQVRRLVKAAGGRAGLGEQLHPHLLRHTNATAQVRKAAAERRPLYEVAENLGHASLDTLKIYTHLDIDSRRETMRDL